MNLRQFMSRVGVCELREANVAKEFLSAAAHAGPKYVKPKVRNFEFPVLMTSGVDPKPKVAKVPAPVKDKGSYISRYVKTNARLANRKYGNTAKSITMGLIAAPGAAAMYGGVEVAESRRLLIMNRLRESRVLDAARKLGGSAVEIGKDLFGAAKEVVTGVVRDKGVRNAARRARLAAIKFSAKHPHVTRELQDTGNLVGPGGLLTSHKAKQGRIREDGKEEPEVEMPKGEYKREHKHLLKVLSTCKTAAAKQEAKKQRKEMRKELKK